METNGQKEISKVGIAGAGGIGAFVSQMLFDYGVNRGQFPIANWDVSIFDDDMVDHTNLLHQNFTTDDIGKSKADIVSERTMGLFTANKRFMTADDFSNFDVIFCCVDSASFRKELYEFWLGKKKKGDLKFWIDGRCSSRQIVMMNAELSKEILTRFTSDSATRASCLLKYEKENNISQVTPNIVAGMMVQCFMNWLRGRSTNAHVLEV